LESSSSASSSCSSLRTTKRSNVRSPNPQRGAAYQLPISVDEYVPSLAVVLHVLVHKVR
jgi:hypothetical protein